MVTRPPGIRTPVNELIVDKGLTQQELARKIGVSRSWLNCVILGKHPSWVVRRKLARFFGCSVNELFPDEDDAA